MPADKWVGWIGRKVKPATVHLCCSQPTIETEQDMRKRCLLLKRGPSQLFFISLKSLSPDFQCSAHSPPNHDTTRPKYRWHTSTCHIFPTPAGLITYLHCGCIYPNVFFSDHQTMNIRVHCKQRHIIRLKIHVLLQAAFKASGSDQWSADAKRIHCNNGVRACRTACHHLEAIRAGGGPQLLFAGGAQRRMWPTLLLRRGGTPDTVDAGQRGRDSYEHIGLCLPAPVGVIKGHNAKWWKHSTSR